MNKLLTYNPEPFTDLDPEADAYEIDAMAGEWETEDAEEEGGKPGRSRMPRMSPRRLAKKPAFRPSAQGRKTTPRVKPLGQPPKVVPRPWSIPALRPTPIPFVPPSWGLRPDLEPAEPRDVPRPDESRRRDQAGAEGSGSPPATAQPSEEPESEHVRWVQECLNRALGLQLPVDGVMNRETRSAVRLFQERRGLAITGLVGPDTEDALQSVCRAATAAPQGANQTPEAQRKISRLASCTYPSWTKQATTNYQLSFEAEPLSRTTELGELKSLDLDTPDIGQNASNTEKAFCFVNRVGDCVTLWGTDPNDAVSPWRLRNWQNPKWSIIGMKYCRPGRCRCPTIFDATARCPAIEKETRDLDEFESLAPDAGDTWFGEGGARPTSKPRVLTYTTSDVIDKRISVPAQHSLVRLSKNPATNADAIGMLTEVKAGRLAGIYCVNWEPAALRARRYGRTWWTVIPKGQGAVLMLDPDHSASGPPLIAFRRELDPRKDGCGSLKSDALSTPFPGTLDAALANVWHQYLDWRRRIGKAPPGTGYVPVGRCGGLPERGTAGALWAGLGLLAPTRLQRRGGARGAKPDFRNPKLCLYGIGSPDEPLFRGQAERLATRVRALDAQGDIKAVPFRTGKNIIDVFEAVARYLSDRGYPKLKQVHIFSHGFEEGLFAVDDDTGLYRDNHVMYRSRRGCAKTYCFKDTFPCDRRCRCQLGAFSLDVPPPNQPGITPRDQGARHLGDLQPNLFDNDVIFVLHACNTANTLPCWLIAPENFANALYRQLRSQLSNPQVYGNTAPDTAGCPRPGAVRRYPTVQGTHKDKGIITRKPPIPDDVYPNAHNPFCPAPQRELALELDLDELAPVGASSTRACVSFPLLKPGQQPVGRVLTYSAHDVIDKRISVPAQHALVRLSKSPATSSAAVGLLEAIKARQLAGIWCVNWQSPARRAQRFGQTWWTVIPNGEDAVLMFDPDNLSGGIPLVGFRRELDTRQDVGCGGVDGKPQSHFPVRLDNSLIKVWHSFGLWRQGRLRPCRIETAWSAELTTQGQPAAVTVPPMCPADGTVVRSCILSQPDLRWKQWAWQWRSASPTVRYVEVIQQRRGGGRSTINDVRQSYSAAIGKVCRGVLIISVGHGGAATTVRQQDAFDMWPESLWPWHNPPVNADHKVTEDFLNYILCGGYASEKKASIKTPDAQKRIEKVEVVLSIGQDLRRQQVTEVMLLTCRVGAGSSTFLEDLANLWRVPVRAWIHRVGIRGVNARERAGLYDDAKQLIYDRDSYEREPPLQGPPCRESTISPGTNICTDATVLIRPQQGAPPNPCSSRLVGLTSRKSGRALELNSLRVIADGNRGQTTNSPAAWEPYTARESSDYRV